MLRDVVEVPGIASTTLPTIDITSGKLVDHGAQ